MPWRLNVSCLPTAQLAANSKLCKTTAIIHDDVIKWKHFPRNWPFMRGIHRSPVNSPHKGQWRGALMFSLICVRINGWVNNREAGDLRRYRSHYDVIVMIKTILTTNLFSKYSWLQRWLQNSIFNFLDRWWYRLPHSLTTNTTHDDVTKWKHFPRC